MKTVRYMLLMLFVASLAMGCRPRKEKIEGIPFKAVKRDKWGMLSADGKLLFEDAFENCPSVMQSGRFWVKNRDGEYELYKLKSNKPVRVGSKTYIDVTDFIHGTAFVAERNHAIQIINKDGGVVADLRTVSGQEVVAVNFCVDGLAEFQTKSGLWGICNERGKVVLSPLFDYIHVAPDGKIFAYQQINRQTFIFDKKGKQTGTIQNDGSFDKMAESYCDGKVIIKVRKNGKLLPAVVKLNGSYVVEPTKKVADIQQITKRTYVYADAKGKCGLRKYNDKILIDAKYDALTALDEKGKLYIAQQGNKYFLLERDGDKIGAEYYKKLYPKLLNDKVLIAINEDGETCIISKKGKNQTQKQDIFYIEMPEDHYVESDIK